MLLRRDPNMTITPLAELTQFLDAWVILLHIIFDRQPVRIEDANLAAQAMQDAGTLIREQPGVGAIQQSATHCARREPREHTGRASCRTAPRP